MSHKHKHNNESSSESVCYEKITVYEHDFVKVSDFQAYYVPCEGENNQEFNGEQGYYNNSLYDHNGKKKLGFVHGQYIKTGDSSELVTDLETKIGSGADYAYQCISQFVLTSDNCKPYEGKNSITAQGPLYYVNNINNGETSVPTRWAITGGTGKYKHASGEIEVKELGCQPISNCDSRLISKYKYKIRVYY
uniref:Allene oxide cyclase superfamily protein n=1 Tax=Fadolivirus 2 TaxID=2740747 RepID=A0A7D3UR16_9VIRU|nr:allene oxide cyclase superfamily protein [Fadolivirus 2]